LMFVAGMMLASIYKEGFRFPRYLALMLLFLGIALIMIPSIGILRRSFIGDFPIESVLIVAGLLSVRISIFKKLTRLLEKLGDSSYSLYMIHPILAPASCLILYKLHIQSTYFVIPITFVVCISAAHFIYRFVENPLNKKAAGFLEQLFSTASPRQTPAKELP